MSEFKDNNNYITLKYKSIEKKIEIPEEFGFAELQKLFLEKFKRQKNENFLFYYIDEDGDQIALNNVFDSDFIFAIDYIKLNNVIIYVEKEENEDKKEMRQVEEEEDEEEKEENEYGEKNALERENNELIKLMNSTPTIRELAKIFWF